MNILLKVSGASLVLLLLACGGSNEDFRFPSPYPIELIGEEYEWHIRYPGTDGQLHTKDDILAKRDLYLPQQSAIVLMLKSADKLYFLELPIFKQIGTAVPDMTHKLYFNTSKTGTSQLKGDQMCGFSHESLYGKLIVESQRRFSRRFSN